MSASSAMSSMRAVGGRAASIERRRALSAGKAALPPPTERVRNGERSAGLPPGAALPASPPAREPTSAAAAGAATAPAGGERAAGASSGLSGRLLSMQRRRLLSAGKQALRGGAPAPLPRSDGSATAAAAGTQATPQEDAACTTESCRAAARARRALLAVRGRGSAPPAAPSRAPREGRLVYAPKVVESVTHGRQTVTGLRIGVGSQVTGVEAGASLPVSGTQYIGSDGGAALRSGGPKVGLARTVNGGIVSGTLVRSRVAVTGDEAGGAVTITGEAEQRPEDDLTQRSDSVGGASAQFQRQVDPHGHSVFGTNLGRSAGRVGSRERRRIAPLESTEGGLAITGTAVGRATRVTGDEDGACRHVSGDQYLSPARAQAECGGSGGGTAPLMPQGATRRDPVTGAKVHVTPTWGRQRITGPDVEHDPRVTGDAPGSCQLITGTPYHGPRTLQGWCDPATGEAAEQVLPRRPATAAVTGDAPVHDEAVTGTARGAARAVTGTPYYRGAAAAAGSAEAADPQDPIAAQEAGFSVHSPQRTAQLRAARAAAEAAGAAADAAGPAGRITGAFAVGEGKITGNLEFLFKPPQAAGRETKPAHARLSGEGRTAGRRISGDSWADQKNVTGTEGFTAVERNPSERQGKPQAFAGAGRFKAHAVNEEPKQLVTGMFGWSSKSAAKVTLSGGAHG